MHAPALIAEIVAHPPALNAAQAPIDFGFWAFFWVYVKADALLYVDIFIWFLLCCLNVHEQDLGVVFHAICVRNGEQRHKHEIFLQRPLCITPKLRKHLRKMTKTTLTS